MAFGGGDLRGDERDEHEEGKIVPFLKGPGGFGERDSKSEGRSQRSR